MFRNFVAAVMVAGLIVGASLGMSVPARADVASDVGAALAANPDGGDALSDAIANMLLGSSDPVATAQAILAALGGASPGQMSAVGTGLGTATALIGLGNPDQASQISALVADADPELQTAFNEALGGATGGLGAPGGNAPRSIIGTTGGTFGPGGSASPN